MYFSLSEDGSEIKPTFAVKLFSSCFWLESSVLHQCSYSKFDSFKTELFFNLVKIICAEIMRTNSYYNYVYDPQNT